MTKITIHWTTPARKEFDALQARIVSTKYWNEFVDLHNEMVVALGDLDAALEFGEPKLHTKKPGGVARTWARRFIVLNYIIFQHDRIGFITKYCVCPANWPDDIMTIESNGKH